MSAPNNTRIAPWLLRNFRITSRQFKAQKRRELRAILRAINTAALACAHLPGGSDPINNAERNIREQIDLCSVKRWGR